MQIFISWSGEPSLTFAKALSEWLPMVIQSVRPFLSTNDIRSGQRWFSEIGKQLQGAKLGVLCLTPNNKEAPWILFEAGAISKIVEESRVVPLLIGLEKAQITAPLSQFQARFVSKEEMVKLIHDINALLETPLEEKRLSQTFEAFWPKLESAISQALKQAAVPAVQPKRRTPDEMVEEILTTVRSLGSSLDQVRMEVHDSQRLLLSSRPIFGGLGALSAPGGTGSTYDPALGVTFSSMGVPLSQRAISAVLASRRTEDAAILSRAAENTDKEKKKPEEK